MEDCCQFRCETICNSKWKSEHQKIVDEINSLKDSKDEYMERGVQLIELIQHAETIYKNATPEKKRKMVELVSSNLMLRDGSLEYQWRKPFDMLAIKGQEENWRGQAASYRTWFIQNPSANVNSFRVLQAA